MTGSSTFRRYLNASKLATLSFLSRAKRRLLGSHVEAVLVSTRNGLLLVNADDVTVGRKLAYSGEYGLDELQRIYPVIGPASAVLVVGAHVGALAVAASKRCAHLTAVEANPKTFRLLKWNLHINDCSNVTAINIAASDKMENIEFVMNRVNSGGSKRAPATRDYAYFYDSPDIVSVPAAPLDEELAGQHFDAILMDIEGSEYFALKGMPGILASAQSLFVEFVPHHLRNVSGVSVVEFVATISPYFSNLFIPSKQVHVASEGFVRELQKMFDRDECDDGLQFSK